MVVIRLARGGAKKLPFYNVVVTDSRKPRDSGYLERIGYFNPFAREHETRLHIDMPRFDYWRGVGAGVSDRMAALLRDFKRGAVKGVAIVRKGDNAPQAASAQKAASAKDDSAEGDDAQQAASAQADDSGQDDAQKAAAAQDDSAASDSAQADDSAESADAQSDDAQDDNAKEGDSASS